MKLKLLIRVLFIVFTLFVTSETSAQRRLNLSNYEMFWNDEFDYTSMTAMFNTPKPKWTSVPHFPDSTHYKTTFEWHGLWSRNTLKIVKGVEAGEPNTPTNGYIEMKPQFKTSFTIENKMRLFRPNGTPYDSTVIKTENFYKNSFLTAAFDGDFACGWPSGTPSWQDSNIRGFHYGVFEIRAKLPRGQSNYSAFWLWNGVGSCEPRNLCGTAAVPHTCDDYNNDCGNVEIDIFEATQYGETFNYFATIQANGFSPEWGSCNSCSTFYNWNGSDPSKTFHTYTMAWTPTSMTWYLDGVEIRHQTTAVPQAKLNLFLSNWCGGSNPNAEAMVVDYVRVYRPKANNISYVYHPQSAITFQQAANPTAFVSLNSTVYKASYANAPHNTDTNFGNFSVAGKSSGTTLIDQSTPVSLAAKGSDSTLLYYNVLSSNNTYQLYMLTNIGRVNGQWRYGTKTVLTNTYPNSKIQIDQITGNIFWIGTDGNIYSRYFWNNQWNIARLNASLSPDNAGTELTYTGAIDNTALGGLPNEKHGARVYYIYQTKLCYYEFSSANGWQRYVTNVTGVKDNIVVSKAPNGKLFYRSTDNHIWTVWVYYGAANTWQYAPLTSTSNGSYAAVDADCTGGLQVSNDGKNVYYLRQNAAPNTARHIAYYDFSTNIPIKKLTTIDDIAPASSLQLITTIDGRTELYYSSTTQNIRSYYERLSSTFPNSTNRVKDWLNTTVSVFSGIDPAITSPSVANCPNCSSLTPSFYVTSNENPTIFGFKLYLAPLLGSTINTYPMVVSKKEVKSAIQPPNPITFCNNLGSPYGVEVRQIIPHVPVVGIKDISSNKGLVLVPNPASEHTVVYLPENQVFEVFLYDISGKILAFYPQQKQTLDIDLYNFPKGIYILQAKSEYQFLTAKIIHQ